jgi:prepilin-type N-terminal cleavage/methylation domain-containing protein
MKLHPHRRQAFTLVEIMIVVGIIGMLSAIAIPTYAHARTLSRKNVCISNLKQLQNAKQQWCLEMKKTLTDTPVKDDLIGPTRYLRDRPVCPGGGADYFTTIGTVQETAACTYAAIEGHTL